MNFVHELYNQLSEPVKHLLDGLSIGAIVAIFLAWLPHFVALGSAVWLGLRMYETVLNIRIARKKLKEL